jgi:S2P endopeptidase
MNWDMQNAMTAVTEDVRFFRIGIIIFFIIPVTFVNVNDDQFNRLFSKNCLRILCAGVWHNVIIVAGFTVSRNR